MPSPLELWIAALNSPHGKLIKTNDRGLLRQQLYRVRKEQGNPLLDAMVITYPIDETELWIMHKEKK